MHKDPGEEEQKRDVGRWNEVLPEWLLATAGQQEEMRRKETQTGSQTRCVSFFSFAEAETDDDDKERQQRRATSATE